MKAKLILIVAILLVAAVTLKSDSPGEPYAQEEKAPVYIYLFAHTEDHINLDLSEERFRRLFPLIERYAKAYPQYGLSWSVQFYGADTQTLLERNPQNGILDFILSFRNKGFIEFGYHGAHEPTYTNNPIARLPRDASWEQTVEAGLQLLSCSKHPYLGGVDCSKPGGLALVQQVFGPAAAISGLGGTAVVHAVDKFNTDSIMFGFADHSPLTERPGYREGVIELMRLLTPEKDTPPELFWMDGRLRVNDGNPLDDVRVLSASQGIESVKQQLAKLDRSRPHVLNMIVGEKFIYARESPTQYAYAHSESPQLPPDLLLSPQEKEARYRRTEETLKYLVEEFFPQNPGSRFVSNRDLLQMAVGPKYGQSTSIETVEAVAQALIADWTDRPPPFVRATAGPQPQYFTLVESFELLTLALGAYAQSQSLPARVPFYKVIGPLERVSASPQATEIPTVEILTRASELTAKFQDRTWKPMPSYIIPSLLAITGRQINAAEFLRLMADLFIAIKEGRVPQSLRLVPGDLLPRSAEIYAKVSLLQFPSGILWSLKPAKISVLSLPTPVATTGFTSSGITGAYLLSFHACDTATANCRDPRNHQVYLAQSNDGVGWSLVPGWTPYPGSVPDVIRRGDTLYVYTPNRLRRYHFSTATWEDPVAVTLTDAEAPGGFVDPSLTVDDQGRLVLFYLLGIPGQDPAQCAPDQTTCVKRFHSATEVPGSDGVAFIGEPGDRVAITLHPNPIDSASDPDIFIEAVRSTTRYVLYVSRGNSIQIYTSLTLHGSYTLLTTLPEGYLTRNTGGIGSGHFDSAGNRYWTYVHTPNGIIRRAAHDTLDKQLAEDDFTTIITGSSIGLGSSWRVESPGFAVNAPAYGHTLPQNQRTLDKIYFQIALNINYSRDPAEQHKIAQTIRKHLDLMSKYGVKANYYFTGLAAEMTRKLDPALIELIKEKSQAKLLTLGHHGANRPPRPMPVDRVKGQNWEEDVKAILDYESCALDPVTGRLDCSRPGGLKNMIENIFKQPLFLTGRFFQASILYATKLFGVKMAVGLQENTGAPRNDAWFLGILNRPDSIAISPEMIVRWAQGGPSPLPDLERRIAALDKTRIRLVSLLIHDWDFFRGRTASQAEQIWQKYEEFVKWAPARGYVIVSLEDLYNLAIDDRERTITKQELQKIAEFYVKQVENSSPRYPPDYIDLNGDYFSLADAWQALAQALAHYQQTGSLLQQVAAKDILGPTVLVKLEMMPRTISADDILKSATASLAQPIDRVPSSVRLAQAGVEVNASEHLYLMAKEFLSLLNGTPTSVELLKINMLSKNVEAIRPDPNDPRNGQADPLTKQQFWTFKPARWK